MAGKKSELGATGKSTAQNIKRLRNEQGITYVELAVRLDAVGRSIPTLGLRRIESGERRVDVDDLLALAAALRVSPASLLMADASARSEIVEATAVGSVRAHDLWEFLTAESGRALRDPDDAAWHVIDLDWIIRSVPEWELQSRYTEGDLKDLSERLTRRGSGGNDREL